LNGNEDYVLIVIQGKLLSLSIQAW